MSEVVLARIVLPPTAEHCCAGLCGQTACSTVEIKVAGGNDSDDADYYVLPLCDAHALNAMTSVFEEARRNFPADEVDLPPWEQTDGA